MYKKSEQLKTLPSNHSLSHPIPNEILNKKGKESLFREDTLPKVENNFQAFDIINSLIRRIKPVKKYF